MTQPLKKQRKKDGQESVERVFVINNKLGLHARPAAVFVQTANRFNALVEVQKEDLKIDGKSIMGIMTLAAEKGSSITVRVTGKDAIATMEALAKLIESDFGE
ncbi:MAG: HPr family phosphocarrier protein [Candidatus Omnitrophota bacterium]